MSEDMSEDKGTRLAGIAEELRSIAVNGLHWAANDYDRARYDRSLQLAAELLSMSDSRQASEIEEQFRGDLAIRTPFVGVDAAIFNNEGRLLLIQRKDNGTWAMPGGAADVGEPPSAVAVREVWEETGLHVQPRSLVGVDGSPAMLEIAHRRLERFGGSYEVVVHELREIGRLKLPERQYQAAISVQTIHNVADEYKPPIFRFIYEALESGGLFLLLDRIAIDTPGLFETYKSLWKRLNRAHGAAVGEGETFEEHVEKVRARGDLPANLEQHLQWLRETGFEAACLHLHGNRALFAARKV